MIALEILNGCRRDGIQLTLTNDGMIRYSGDEYPLKYWLPIMAAQKLALIEALSLGPFAPTHPEIRRCQDCKHFATPGLSDGYCGQREDLPAAYGINHPLRRLPTDNGESCTEYSACDWLQP